MEASRKGEESLFRLWNASIPAPGAVERWASLRLLYDGLGKLKVPSGERGPEDSSGVPLAKAQAVLTQDPDQLVNIHRQTWESCALEKEPVPKTSHRA
ncbi:hypothetical protein SRHO_G00264520 [Serrasalmus rhombeus]